MKSNTKEPLKVENLSFPHVTIELAFITFDILLSEAHRLSCHLYYIDVLYICIYIFCASAVLLSSFE